MEANSSIPNNGREGHRRRSASMNLGDERGRRLLEVVMLRQELQGKVYQFKKMNGKIHVEENSSPVSAVPSICPKNESDDIPGMLLMIKNSPELLDVNIEEMADDSDELIELGNLSMRLSESIGDWMAQNGETLTKISTGTQIAGQLTVGSVAGYASAALVKRFGKLVLGSILGGFILLKIAHGRDYVKVDWNKVFHIDPIQAPEESGEGDSSLDDIHAAAWIANKINSLLDWAKQNSYLAIGFGTGFAIAIKSFSR